ncbi:alpha-amylase family glycosyl hydrolase [Azospirillum picis]|uniref:Alpha-glucosidase n=1 Tax=Azospirillum picis TaxID=488438 RepID=A0ABU0MGY2_9PROT|nr:alpha-amylase family glycosyl hydrolase [Azospirillum picis]MBP2299076.1 alpha-glucosidase [Azospirillum picis]MDQ0532682.1 alpha-glucosidase [Azospirillum picis]
MTQTFLRMPPSGPDPSWLNGAAIYQIYPLSFRDRGGDGWGDLEGVLEGLDHVASLGVDGVWISPFYPSPRKDFGYDVADHRAVDPRMGNLTVFDRLVERAHGLGLKVLVDLVCGHTSDAHPWFIDSRRSRAGDRADWYVWADAKPDGTAPNNWLSVFGGAAWSWEPRRRQYYLHHFLPSQPALNLHEPAVMDALCETAAFWMERGVDGFRIDAVDFFAHDPQLRSNPAAVWREAEPPLKPFALQQHVYDMMHPAIGGILARLRETVDRYPGRVLLGELSSQPGAVQRIAAYCTPQGLHAAYTLSLAKQPFSAKGFSQALAAVPRPDSICWSLSNHDVERAASRWLPEGADPEVFNALLAMLAASLPGTVCVYQGEELGLPNAVLEQHQLRDPFGITYWPDFPGRDGSRTPMPWRGDEPNAGFSSGEPWLPVPPPHAALAVDRQERLAGSPLAVWRAALALRHDHEILRSGSVAAVEDHGDLLSFERTLDGERLLAVFNLADRPAEFSMRGRGEVEALIVPRAPGSASPEVAADGRLLVMPPLSAFLGRLRPSR